MVYNKYSPVLIFDHALTTTPCRTVPLARDHALGAGPGGRLIKTEFYGFGIYARCRRREEVKTTAGNLYKLTCPGLAGYIFTSRKKELNPYYTDMSDEF